MRSRSDDFYRLELVIGDASEIIDAVEILNDVHPSRTTPDTRMLLTIVLVGFMNFSARFVEKVRLVANAGRITTDEQLILLGEMADAVFRCRELRKKFIRSEDTSEEEAWEEDSAAAPAETPPFPSKLSPDTLEEGVDVSAYTADVLKFCTEVFEGPNGEENGDYKDTMELFLQAEQHLRALSTARRYAHLCTSLRMPASATITEEFIDIQRGETSFLVIAMKLLVARAITHEQQRRVREFWRVFKPCYERLPHPVRVELDLALTEHTRDFNTLGECVAASVLNWEHLTKRVELVVVDDVIHHHTYDGLRHQLAGGYP